MNFILFFLGCCCVNTYFDCLIKNFFSSSISTTKAEVNANRNSYGTRQSRLKLKTQLWRAQIKSQIAFSRFAFNQKRLRPYEVTHERLVIHALVTVRQPQMCVKTPLRIASSSFFYFFRFSGLELVSNKTTQHYINAIFRRELVHFQL